MVEPLSIEPGRSALLVMDYQVGIVAMRAAGSAAALERATAVLAAARRAGLAVIYIQVGFRQGHPEVSPRNQSFSAISQSGRFVLGEADTEIHPALAPRAGDLIVVKHRVSAFAGTDLETILRAREINTLVMIGIATSGVVLSTIRHAADADYRLVVVKDCCLDRDEGVHRCLTEKVFPRQATVLTSDEILPVLRSSTQGPA
jgi:nicotinamidase-related amidase